MGQGREGSKEGHGSWCNLIEKPTNFEEIPDSKGCLDSVAASRTGHRTRPTDSFLIPWDLNHVAYIVVVERTSFQSKIPEYSVSLLHFYFSSNVQSRMGGVSKQVSFMKMICGCQCLGRLTNDLAKTWPHRR